MLGPALPAMAAHLLSERAAVRLDDSDFARIDALMPPCSAAVSYRDRAMGLDIRSHGHRNLI
jgi:hypothetical protein